MKRNRTGDEIKQPKKMTSIGGQALMEGLMMIGPQTMAMAVRKPDGQIHVETAPIGKSSTAAKIPFVRGSVKIFRQMITGTRYLLRSAQFVEDDIKQEDSKAPLIDNSSSNLSSEPQIDNSDSNLSNEALIDNSGSNLSNEPLIDNSGSDLSNEENDRTGASESDEIGVQFESSNPNKESVFTDVPVNVATPTTVASAIPYGTAITEPDIAITEPEKAIISAGGEQETPIPAQLSSKEKRKKQKEIKMKEKEEKEPGRFERFLMGHTEALLYMSAIFGIFLSVGLFILLPNLITNLTIGFFIDKNLSIMNRVIYSLFEGVLRITIFVVYLGLASKLKDIQRVWMYHGAEHKTIACYESGLPLTVENTRGFSKHHPRCGTAFMFIILMISIILFSFVPKINIIVDLLIRLACVPLLAGLSYEVIHWAAKRNNKFTRALSWPGLMLQRLTTKEPDDSMLEVAIAAMIPVIPAGERGDEW